MARIGMKYPTYAAEATYTAGTGITYSTGKIFAHAIEANVTPNRRDNPLYGDDEKIENDKGLTDYTIALTVDKIAPAERAALLGETAAYNSATPPAVTHYMVTDSNPPYVGFGYMTVMQENNTPVYEAYWFHRVQFALDSETAATKQKDISWGTYNLTGTGFGVTLDNTNGVQFYDHMQFSSEASALAWLKSRAGIS